MRNFRLFLLSLIVFTGSLFIYSCSKETNYRVDENENQATEKRSAACPNLIMTLEVVPASPCAYVKFSFNGTDDPSSDCTLTSYDIKIFKTRNVEDIKDFNSAFSASGNPRYPNKHNWVGTLCGSYVNLRPEELLIGSFSSPTPITDANGSFVYIIPSKFTWSPKTWVWNRIAVNCNKEECITPKCFDAYTPCI